MFKTSKIINNFAIIQKIKKLIVLIFFCSVFINFLTIAISFYSMQIFDKVLNSSSLETLFYLTFITIILIFFVNYFYGLRIYLMQKINIIIQKKILNNIDKLESLDEKNIAIQNLQKISSFFYNNSPNIFFEIILSIFYLVVIYLIHLSLAVYGLIMVLIVILFENYQQKNIVLLQRNLQKNQEENSDFLLKNKYEINSLKFYEIKQNIFKKWLKKYKISLNLEKNYFNFFNNYLILNKNLRVVLQILATMICAYLVIKNQISVGSIIAVSILLSKFLEPFSNFSTNIKNYKEFKNNFKKIFNENKSIYNSLDCELIPIKTFNKITFKKIFYRHQSDKNFVIQSSNFCINSKKIIAILSKNDLERGAVYNLLIKNYCPTYGNIEIDNIDLKNISQNQLSQIIDIIDNDLILFDGNIIENIAKISDNFSQEKIINFIKNFPINFDFLILKNGFFSDIKDLNLEQRYWVCVLRAIYSSPKVLFVEKLNFGIKFHKFFDYLINYKNSNESIIFINNPPLEFLKKTDNVIFFKNDLLNFFNTKDFINYHEKAPKLLT